MANSKSLCSSCKRTSITILELDFESDEPLFPPPSDSEALSLSRSGSVSSAVSEWSTSTVESVGLTTSTTSTSTTTTRPVIRIRRLSNGKIHWVSGVTKGLNWYWFGRRNKLDVDMQGIDHDRKNSRNHELRHFYEKDWEENRLTPPGFGTGFIS